MLTITSCINSLCISSIGVNSYELLINPTYWFISIHYWSKLCGSIAVNPWPRHQLGARNVRPRFGYCCEITCRPGRRHITGFHGELCSAPWQHGWFYSVRIACGALHSTLRESNYGDPDQEIVLLDSWIPLCILASTIIQQFIFELV